MTDRERRRLSEISDNRGTPKGIALRVEIVLGAARGIANCPASTIFSGQRQLFFPINDNYS
ncbi:MAG TPA: hypothetical protein VKV17_09160 [Bryobacteraceae bacterium]|nr:hypothetical protein [Bryobacteraceae bacterium]